MSGISFHVSLSGDDSWSGRLPGPDANRKDGPFRTLEAARDGVRRLNEGAGLPAGGVSVWVRGGDYNRSTTFALGPQDSGTPEAPVVYRPWKDEQVRLLGGVRIDPTTFVPVTDVRVRTRLAANARDNVVQADLRAQGIFDFGAFSPRGFDRPTAPAHLEVFVNNQPMTVAQWPDAGQFLTIAGYTKTMINEWGFESGDLTGGLEYEGDRPAHWAPSDNIWVHGYWAYDWANSYERVRRLDPKARVVETAAPHGHYHFSKGQRFYFLNVLEELDQPGEYFVDRDSGLLYLWPPRPLDGADIVVSGLHEPLVTLKDVSHVTLRGLTIEAGRGSGIRVEGGTSVQIADCVIRNLGNWGVVVEGGTRHTVSGCDIYSTGDGGVDIRGGDRASLTPCNHAVLGNHIYDYARWTRTYVAGVCATGVGLRIAGNLIHHAPHIAVLFWGNDIVIEDNEIHHVCLETGDAGAIYTGRDYTFRGNVIRRNFIHHMGGVGMGSMGIYMDDCVSGTQIVGNILWDCQYGIFLGGGRDFVVEYNILVDCRVPIHADARGVDQNPVWQNMVNVDMRQRLEAMHPLEPPYARYPEIAAVMPYFAGGKGVPPENNRVERNVLVCRAGCFRLVPGGAAFERNLYWCETGPVIFRRDNTAIYASQAFPEGFKAESSRFAPLDGVRALTRFVNQSGNAEALAGAGELRFDRQGGTLDIHGLFKRPAFREALGGPIWFREHLELFLKPYSGLPGMVQIALASDGETAVVWHDCAGPADFQWKTEVHETPDGWQAKSQIPLDVIAAAVGGNGAPQWSFLAGFIAHPEAGDWAWWQGQGHDSEGVVADPMFVDLPKGDFRLRPDSPALKLGLISFEWHSENDGTVSVCGIDFSQRNTPNK